MVEAFYLPTTSIALTAALVLDGTLFGCQVGLRVNFTPRLRWPETCGGKGWRRGPESNRRVKVLQTVILTTQAWAMQYQFFTGRWVCPLFVRPAGFQRD